MDAWVHELRSGSSEVAWGLFLDRYRRLIFAAIRHYAQDYDDVMDVFAPVRESMSSWRRWRFRRGRIAPPPKGSEGNGVVEGGVWQFGHTPPLQHYRASPTSDVRTSDRGAAAFCGLARCPAYPPQGRYGRCLPPHWALQESLLSASDAAAYLTCGCRRERQSDGQCRDGILGEQVAGRCPFDGCGGRKL